MQNQIFQKSAVMRGVLSEKHSGGKVGQNPRWDSVVLGSPRSQEDWGVPSMMEISSIGVGKLAAIIEPRNGL